MLLEEKSVMYSNIFSETKLKDQVNVIFRTILTRLPSRKELTVARNEINANGRAGHGNVVWALVNTREFLFIQ